jgi:ribosomal protein S18 acetylase RimI-like enzyme
MASWSDVDRPRDVLGLANQIQVEEPHNYRPDEIVGPEDWFPAGVNQSWLVLLAYADTDRPVCYAVALALTYYPEALAVTARQRVHAPDTGYLVELGVSPAQCRRGIANALLTRMIDKRSPSAWLVRTLQNNTPAIALYQHHCFELVPEVLEVRHGRPRVYLAKL